MLTATARALVSIIGTKGENINIAWSPDGKGRQPLLEPAATASGDKTVRIWDARTNKSQAVIGTKGENINIAWSPDGKGRDLLLPHCTAAIDILSWPPIGLSDDGAATGLEKPPTLTKIEAHF